LATNFKMKEIGLMHYFLGLEVWKISGKIFLGKGKYKVDILKRIGIEDCRLMDTPIVTNINKVNTLDSELVDLNIYKNLIGSFIYLVKTKPYICFSINTLSMFMVASRHVHYLI
jgi:hypothetical protein